MFSVARRLTRKNDWTARTEKINCYDISVINKNRDETLPWKSHVNDFLNFLSAEKKTEQNETSADKNC